MTFRATLSAVTLAAVAAAGAADEPPLVPKKPFTDELKEPKQPTPWLGWNDSYYGYMTKLPVEVKGAGRITIKGTVAGNGRRVALALLDPTGEMIAATRRDADVGATNLTVKQLPAGGEYHILIVSNQIGEYTVTADFADGANENQLKARVERLREELKKAEADLESYQKKQKRGKP